MYAVPGVFGAQVRYHLLPGLGFVLPGVGKVVPAKMSGPASSELLVQSCWERAAALRGVAAADRVDPAHCHPWPPRSEVLAQEGREEAGRRGDAERVGRRKEGRKETETKEREEEKETQAPGTRARWVSPPRAEPLLSHRHSLHPGSLFQQRSIALGLALCRSK